MATIFKKMGEAIAIKRDGSTTVVKLPDADNNVEATIAKKDADTVLVFVGEEVKKAPGIQLVAGERTATKKQSTAVIKTVGEWLMRLSTSIYHSDGHKAAEGDGVLAIMPPQAADIDDEYTNMVISAVTEWLKTAKHTVVVTTPPEGDKPDDKKSEGDKPDDKKPEGEGKPEDGKKSTPALTEADLENATHALRYRLANTPGYVVASFDPAPYRELFKKLNPDKK